MSDFFKEDYEIVVKPGDMFYRYNLGANVPNHWSLEYVSPEYVFPNLGAKNKIGAFFFYNTNEAAINTLSQALINEQLRGVNYDVSIITSCCASKEMYMLDLSKCNWCAQIIYVLFQLGINVVSDNFFLHQRNRSFAALKEQFELLSSDDCILKLRAISTIDEFFFNNKPLLCQTLTDFGNGKHFKRLLQDKGYDGYVFKESPDGNTFCLFTSDNLSSPQQDYIEI